MRISVGLGTYVVAVSGGVDSMVLLDLLVKQPRKSTLIVAHFDHGIRPDSAKDRKLVQDIAKAHKLQFVHAKGELGPNTSEAVAREARYQFLKSVQNACGAQAIITAHHQDDVLETVVFNLLRGTGRKGLTSLKSTDGIIRPLLEYNKEEIREFAKDNAIRWNEDPTNLELKYARNYIRHKVVPKLGAGPRAALIILLEQITAINRELDEHLTSVLHIQPSLSTLDRNWFIGLPHEVAGEVLHTWLRRHEVHDITRKAIEKLIVKMKTGKSGQTIHIDKQYDLKISRNNLALSHSER